MLTHIFKKIEAGSFGPLDISNMHATGISSGGYMTSRMAFSYPGRFRSLAIQSGSYFYCAGPICANPKNGLPKDHPPTLFLHGDLDPIVPGFTERKYFELANASGVKTKLVAQHDAW